ncbi:hypothetical protein [Streptomyces sp. KN37]|uniref:hypothetical protein n=1 Tax=Streptomyces sp. KN37 TaxID=3090667 RepID=UPI002A74F0E3|nr:hypothetical protein [Streptomyces sp. KN37]WPO76731.1 hypothetical protein R9806_39605 [Streptomyces sp. KN37]
MAQQCGVARLELLCGGDLAGSAGVGFVRAVVGHFVAQEPRDQLQQVVVMTVGQAEDSLQLSVGGDRVLARGQEPRDPDPVQQAPQEVLVAAAVQLSGVLQAVHLGEVGAVQEAHQRLVRGIAGEQGRASGGNGGHGGVCSSLGSLDFLVLNGGSPARVTAPGTRRERHVQPG